MILTYKSVWFKISFLNSKVFHLFSLDKGKSQPLDTGLWNETWRIISQDLRQLGGEIHLCEWRERKLLTYELRLLFLLLLCKKQKQGCAMRYMSICASVFSLPEPLELAEQFQINLKIDRIPNDYILQDSWKLAAKRPLSAQHKHPKKMAETHHMLSNTRRIQTRKSFKTYKCLSHQKNPEQLNWNLQISMREKCVRKETTTITSSNLHLML